jgi:flagellar biosynthesis GTPase FlhF
MAQVIRMAIDLKSLAPDSSNNTEWGRFCTDVISQIERKWNRKLDDVDEADESDQYMDAEDGHEEIDGKADKGEEEKKESLEQPEEDEEDIMADVLKSIQQKQNINKQNKKRTISQHEFKMNSKLEGVNGQP